MIEVTEHALQRARRRFRWDVHAVRRHARLAYQDGRVIHDATSRATVMQYRGVRFVFAVNHCDKPVVRLVTVYRDRAKDRRTCGRDLDAQGWEAGL